MYQVGTVYVLYAVHTLRLEEPARHRILCLLDKVVVHVMTSARKYRHEYNAHCCCAPDYAPPIVVACSLKSNPVLVRTRYDDSMCFVCALDVVMYQIRFMYSMLSPCYGEKRLPDMEYACLTKSLCM